MTVWEVGGEGFTTGVTQFAMAGMMDAKGGLVQGRCIMPDGSEVKEGNYIQLGW